MRGVTVRHGEVDAHVGVDQTLATGERVALLGASGAGKSSLLDVAAGLVTPTSGSVEVLGDRPGELRGRALRAHRTRVGSVRQSLDLALPLRVIHNVNAGRLGTWSTSASLWSLIRPSGRAEALTALDAVGLADRLWSRTDELSGGERQRVAVARVLRQGAELVLADEPTSSVDPQLADLVMRALCGTSDGRTGEVADERLDGLPTVIAAVHDPALARRHFDRIVGLRGGQVSFDLAAPEVDDSLLDELYRTGRHAR